MPVIVRRFRDQLIGRARELGLLSELLGIGSGGVRLVTLIGEPGVGKSRLAFELATSLEHVFEGGAYWVSLEAIRDPAQVLVAIANEIPGVCAAGTKLQLPAQRPGGGRMLLVLDNFEQVLPARDEIADLVDLRSDVVVLVTSRVPLHLCKEQVFSVDPLEIPGPASDRNAVGWESDAARLFVVRATAAGSVAATLDELSDVQAVVDVSRRLDGIPLAIELAAARLQLFGSPRALLWRMDWGMLPLLVGGPSDYPARHQTMRAAIEWSYELLDESERALLRRLSVFASSFSAAAAAYANAGPSIATDVLPTLEALVHKGLLRLERSDSNELRFRLPDPTRELAREALAGTADLQSVEMRCVQWFVQFSEAAEEGLRGRQQVQWLDRLQRERPNVMAVLQWADENGVASIGLELSNALRRFWMLSGAADEGQRWLDRFLDMDGGVDGGLRARALTASGMLAAARGDHAAALHQLRRAETLWSEVADEAGLARTLMWLAKLGLRSKDLDAARDYAARSLILCQRGDNRHGQGWCLLLLGDAARLQRQDTRVWADRYAEALHIWRGLGDRLGTAATLRHVGFAACANGDFAGAVEHFEESFAIFRELGYQSGTAWTLVAQGNVERCRSRYASAEQAHTEALGLLVEHSRCRTRIRATCPRSARCRRRGWTSSSWPTWTWCRSIRK